MIGGATDLGAVELSDGELLAIVTADLERTMGLRLMPEFVNIIRHWRGIPQYTIGHGGRLARIEHALAPHRGLFLAGNSYRGVSINACIEDARRVAGLVADHLRTLEWHTGYRAAR
jgi:oxygen-dependent protoporphyrinogen oxidase